MRNLATLGILVGAGALLTLAAACGGQAGGAAAGSGGSLSVASLTAGSVHQTMIPAPSNPSRPAMPGIHLPAGSVPVAGTKVDASGLPGGFPREVWTENGGTTLGLYGEEGGCSTASATVAAQTGSQVVVHLVQQEPGGGKACPMYLRYKPMTVTLAQPLGDRTVVLNLTIQRG